MTWTPELTDKLTKLWNDGYSGSQCAQALGMTRNAVIGKAHRLKLGQRKAIIVTRNVGWSAAARETAKGVQRVKRLRRIEAEVSPKVDRIKSAPAVPIDDQLPHHAVWQALPGTNPIPLVELTPDTCRWPLGDGPFTFCGCTPAAGSVYCTTHKARAVGIGTVSERAAAREAA